MSLSKPTGSDRRTAVSWRCCCGFRGVSTKALSNPKMAFSGVRISWLILAEAAARLAGLFGLLFGLAQLRFVAFMLRNIVKTAMQPRSTPFFQRAARPSWPQEMAHALCAPEPGHPGTVKGHAFLQGVAQAHWAGGASSPSAWPAQKYIWPCSDWPLSCASVQPKRRSASGLRRCSALRLCPTPLRPCQISRNAL